MSFERVVRIPAERVAVLIGKRGETKKDVERLCGVEVHIDGRSGEIVVKAAAEREDSDPFKAVSVVEAVGRGFSPQRAMRLLETDVTLELIDLREYTGKSEKALKRIRGRVIGLHGKSRRVMEELTHCSISVFGRTVALIGEPGEIRLAKEAIDRLAGGSAHRSVYNMLQRERTKKKMERMILWEDQSPEIGETRQEPGR